MEKRIGWGLLLIILCLLPAPAQAAEADTDFLIQQQLQALDFSEVESFLEEVDKEAGAYLPDLSLPGIIRGIREGEIGFSLGDIFQGLLRYLFHELIANSSLLGELIVLAVVCAVLQNLQTAFERNTVSHLAHAVVFLVLIVLAVSSFTIAVNTGRQTIDEMVSFVQAILPVLLTLMASLGAVTSAAILHPFVLGAITVLGGLIQNIIFPLIYLAAVLGIVTRITDRVPASRLAGLAKDVATAGIGLSLTAFLGVLVIQGVAGAAGDGLALRTAKYATGAFIPVVGKTLTDAVEVVASTSLLIKDAVGLIGAIVITVISLFPALKILSLVVIYKLAAALVQPLGDDRIAASLDSMGNSLVLVFAAVIMVGLMFFLALAIIVGLGNFTVMLR